MAASMTRTSKNPLGTQTLESRGRALLDRIQGHPKTTEVENVVRASLGEEFLAIVDSSTFGDICGMGCLVAVCLPEAERFVFREGFEDVVINTGEPMSAAERAEHEKRHACIFTALEESAKDGDIISTVIRNAFNKDPLHFIQNMFIYELLGNKSALQAIEALVKESGLRPNQIGDALKPLFEPE